MAAGFEMDPVEGTKKLQKFVADIQKKSALYPATVVKVIDDNTVVINRGSKHGGSMGDKFMIYEVSEESIEDPTDGRILGHLEIPKGTGKVINVQDEMTTIESDRKEEEKKVIIKQPAFIIYSSPETVNIYYRQMPFKNPCIGDKAKPIE